MFVGCRCLVLFRVFAEYVFFKKAVPEPFFRLLLGELCKWVGSASDVKLNIAAIEPAIARGR